MKLKKIIAAILTSAMMMTVVSSLPAPQVVQAAEYEGYQGSDLGATYTSSKTTFKVWAPTASKVQIKRYKTGSDSESGAGVIETKDMTKGSQNVWSIEISGDLKDTYYTYLVDGRETPDVYGRTTGINGDRSMVIDLQSTNPSGWDSDKRVDSPNQTDAIVWECHVKDFSNSASSGIDQKYRGKFMAFTQTGTTLNGDGITKTGIDHLKELGVTHVQILPMFDYASLDERSTNSEDFNWGYDPKNYNVPEGSYSTNPYDGNSRVKELKEMVKALHDAGIGVVMDVVYNHTYAPFGQAGNQTDFQKQQYSPLDRTVPGYYYTSTDWSGCGNSCDSTKEMYRKYMIDSMVYWATEYHLDGFRFDLMGIHDVNTINQIRAALNKVDSSIKIWGEPWCGDGTKNGLSGYANKPNCKSLDNNIALFSDNARDAIKGNTRDGKLSNAGWVTGNGSRQTEVIAGIKAQCGDYSNVNQNIWSKQPSQVVTYTSCHDNHALYDILCMTMGYAQDGSRHDDIVNMNKLSAAIVLTSQGVSFMQAGEEFGRSKYGDHNSYKSAASVNQLDWNRVKSYGDLSSYYSGLIEIRKNVSAFRDPTTSAGNRIQWLSTSNNKAIGYTLTNTKSGEWNKVACLFNSDSNATNINLSGEWVVVANNTKSGTQSLGTVSGNVSVPGRSAMVLVEKSTFDSTVIGKTGTVLVKHVDENGTVIKTETKTGKAGTSYSTSALTTDEYILVSTPSNASGKFTEGTTTVTYTYKKDTTPRGSVVVKYVDKATKTEISPSTTTTGKLGTSYSTTALSIKGYDLDSSSLPTNASGTYTSSTITVTYYYIEKEVKNLIVHYYNANNWSNVNIYAYDESTGVAKQYTGAWPGTKMNSDGNKWYSFDVTEAESGSVIINDGGSNKEPAGASAPGYDASGEVWIKDGKVYDHDPDGKGIVMVKCVDEDTNEELLAQKTISGSVGETYTTEASKISGYTLSQTPANASGKYINGTITVIYKYKKDVVIVDPKVNSFVANVTTPQIVKTNIKLTATGTGTGTLRYKFTAIKDGESNLIQSYSTNNSCVWTPTEAGTYTLRVDIIDSNDKIANKTMNYIINGGLSLNSFVTDVNTQAVGKNVTMKATVANAEGTPKYKFYVYLNGALKASSTGSTSNSYVWTPKAAGKYTLKVVATDNTGKQVSGSRTITITELFKITAFNTSSVSPQNLGTTIKLAATATGGTGTKYYRYAAYLNGTAKYVSSWSTTNITSWKPTVAGNYVLYAQVKDTTGKVLSITKAYTIANPKPITISQIATSVKSPQKANTSISIKTTAVSSTNKTLQYMYWAYNSTLGTWTLIRNYSTSALMTWKPTVAGTYTILVQVRDASGNVASKFIDYNITETTVNVEETNSLIKYSGTWINAAGSSYSGGSCKYTAVTGAKLGFKFKGTGVNIYSALGSGNGIMKVTVDSKSYIIDTYSSTKVNQKSVANITGLANTTHTVIIENVGMVNPNSTGKNIVVDKFVISGGTIVTY